MTFVQPKKQIYFQRTIFAILLLPLVVGAFTLVVVYNQVVNANARIKAANLSIQNLQLQSAELKEKIFRILGSQNLEKLAKEQGLTQDKNPEYIKIGKRWDVFASQY